MARFTEPLVRALGLHERAACVVSGDTAARAQARSGAAAACARRDHDRSRRGAVRRRRPARHPGGPRRRHAHGGGQLRVSRRRPALRPVGRGPHHPLACRTPVARPALTRPGAIIRADQRASPGEADGTGSTLGGVASPPSAASSLALFGIVGALAIPAAARWGLETVASRELGRTVRVEAISANPYTLRVTLKGLTVDGLPGESAPLLTVREASINASISSAAAAGPRAGGHRDRRPDRQHRSARGAALQLHATSSSGCRRSRRATNPRGSR